jgi:hypothetical protein
VIFCFKRTQQVSQRVRSGPIRATVGRVSNHEIEACFQTRTVGRKYVRPRFCGGDPGDVECGQSIRFLQRRNECRSVSLMPALAVNSGTRAWEIAAASTARPRQRRVVVLTLGLRIGRAKKVSMRASRLILRRTILPPVPSAYRKRVSGLLTIRIKGALGGNYSFDTLPWIDCFAFNAEIIRLVPQNKGIATGA